MLRVWLMLAGLNMAAAQCDASCPAGMYDATYGNCNYWSCGQGCAGGIYTDSSCLCACQCASGLPSQLRSSDGPCCNCPAIETCIYSRDAECDDGGVGSEYALCSLGSDCYDCGAREVNCGSD
ncbi:MAG: hypothetical protein SGPRY_001706, partial [Prymnesium sp.]